MPIHYRETSQPAVEPVSVDQVKQQCRIESIDEDDLINGYIIAARQLVEKMMQRSIYNRNVRLSLDFFPVVGDEASCGSGQDAMLAWFFRAQSIRLPLPALASLTSITYRSDYGTMLTLDPASYVVDSVAEPARIMPAPGYSWPAINNYVPGQVVIDFVSGTYGDGEKTDNCPQTIKLAILLLVGHWYMNREAVGGSVNNLPLGVDSLLAGEKFESCYG